MNTSSAWRNQFQTLKGIVDQMPVDFPALEGCAVVDVSTGVVVHGVGRLVQEGALAEASTDYWRHYQRHGSFFEELGPLRYCVLIHQEIRITMFPCSQEMILIFFTQEGQAVDWKDALGRAAHIRELAASL
ncbi:hypothetical protein E9531_08940 [Lampropedia puyangensis]|uniref:Roadblock/LC7 domain-containing protein n=1 Tax=Lampropedia puyangensis TaxID=1330072 RepID=A0A4S8F2F5_9BURK|nr:hypothetical protein [Lampropedia puyangensis]THU01483.1 hypothetical protein E9531_08940 [Lampropedia puyangensis]